MNPGKEGGGLRNNLKTYCKHFGFENDITPFKASLVRIAKYVALIAHSIRGDINALNIAYTISMKIQRISQFLISKP